MSNNNFPILLALLSVFCVAYVIHGCISVARGRMPEATMDVGEGREQDAEASLLAMTWWMRCRLSPLTAYLKTMYGLIDEVTKILGRTK